MEVKSEYFRCISNFIYSYEISAIWGKFLLRKEKKAADVLEGVVSGRSEDQEGRCLVGGFL